MREKKTEKGVCDRKQFGTVETVRESKKRKKRNRKMNKDSKRESQRKIKRQAYRKTKRKNDIHQDRKKRTQLREMEKNKHTAD